MAQALAPPRPPTLESAVVGWQPALSGVGCQAGNDRFWLPARSRRMRHRDRRATPVLAGARRGGALPARVERVGSPAPGASLGRAPGGYVVEVGGLNTLVYLWQYDDAADRERRRAALSADNEFAEFRRSVRELMVAQHTEILIPQ